MEVRIKRGNHALRQAHTRLCERAGFVQTYASTVIRKNRRESERWWSEEDTRLDVEARARVENLRKMCIESTGWGISTHLQGSGVQRPTEALGDRRWGRSEKFSSLREELILGHMKEVEDLIDIWRKKVPTNLMDEMRSLCYAGMVDAARRYLPIYYGNTFWTYACQRIKGYIKDYMRSIDWVKRGDRKKHEEDPDFEIHHMVHFTMSENTDDGDLDLYQNLGEIDKSYDKVSDRETLSKAMRGFNRQERQVVQLYAVDGYTLRVVGDIMDLSESRVCQLWQQILTKVKEKHIG